MFFRKSPLFQGTALDLRLNFEIETVAIACCIMPGRHRSGGPHALHDQVVNCFRRDVYNSQNHKHLDCGCRCSCCRLYVCTRSAQCIGLQRSGEPNTFHWIEHEIKWKSFEIICWKSQSLSSSCPSLSPSSLLSLSPLFCHVASCTLRKANRQVTRRSERSMEDRPLFHAFGEDHFNVTYLKHDRRVKLTSFLKK